MPLFGEYETIGEPFAVTEERGHTSTVWQARKSGASDARLYVVKCYVPRARRPKPGEAQPEEALGDDPYREYLEGIKQLKKAQSEGGRCLSPVHAFGIHPDEGAWYVTDFFPGKSLKEWITLRGRVDGAGLRNVVYSALTGCLALKRSRGYSHGNLKTSNVFLLGKPRPLRERPLLLGDPYPAAPLQLANLEGADKSEAMEMLAFTMQAHDLRAIGELILQLVEGRLLRSNYDYNYPITGSTAWDRLGKAGEYWRGVCNRLLDPNLPPEKENLDKLELEFRPDWKIWVKDNQPRIVSAAGAICVIGAAVYLFWPKPTPPHSLPLTVTVDDKIRPYGVANPPLTARLSEKVRGVAAAGVTTASESSAVGEYEITAILNDSGNRLWKYKITTNIGNLRVTNAVLTVKAANQNRSYGTNNPPLTGTITGTRAGDRITADYTTSATFGSEVGEYEIAAALSDPAGKLVNYTVITNKGTLTVTPVELTVTAENTNRSFGAPDPSLRGSIAGLRNRDRISVEFRTEATRTSPAGNYDITPVLSDPDKKLHNYSVIINKGTLSVIRIIGGEPRKPVLTVAANNLSRFYGMTNPPLTGSVNPSKPGDSITATFSTSAMEGSPVGTYEIVPTLSDPGSKLGDYTVVTNIGTLTVKRRVLTVTADDKTRVYGTTNPPLTGLISGARSEDAITVTFITTAGPASGTGKHEIVPLFNDPSNRLANYQVATNKGTLTIARDVVTVTVNNQSRAYGATNPPLTGTFPGLRSGEVVQATYRTVARTSSPVGTYEILPIFNDPGNRLASFTIMTNRGVLTVTQAVLKVVVDSKSRPVGGPNPALTGRIVGLTNGDLIIANYRTKAGPGSPPGVYEIEPVFDDPAGRLGNYTVMTNRGNLTITGLAENPNLASNPPKKTLFGIPSFDFVWVPGLGPKKLGAYVAVHELSLGQYRNLSRTAKRTLEVTPHREDSNDDTLPARFDSYQDASGLVAALNRSAEVSAAQLGLPRARWRLLTEEEYEFLAGIPTGGWYKDQDPQLVDVGWIPKPETVTALQGQNGSNLARGYSTKPGPVTTGPLDKNGLRYLVDNAQEWTSQGEPFGVACDATTARSSLGVNKRRPGVPLGLRLVADAGD